MESLYWNTCHHIPQSKAGVVSDNSNKTFPVRQNKTNKKTNYVLKYKIYLRDKTLNVDPC